MKKKLIAGITSVVLFTGVGAAYASNAVEQHLIKVDNIEKYQQMLNKNEERLQAKSAPKAYTAATTKTTSLTKSKMYHELHDFQSDTDNIRDLAMFIDSRINLSAGSAVYYDWDNAVYDDYDSNLATLNKELNYLVDRANYLNQKYSGKSGYRNTDKKDMQNAIDSLSDTAYYMNQKYLFLNDFIISNGQVEYFEKFVSMNQSMLDSVSAFDSNKYDTQYIYYKKIMALK